MNIKEAEEFVESLKWKYSKTYPKAPHEYSVLNWSPSKKDKMVEFAHLIQDKGRDEYFYKKKFKVLDINEYKYWTMDEPLEKTDLINRTYRDNIFKDRLASFISGENFLYNEGMTLDDITRQMNSTKANTREKENDEVCGKNNRA